MATSKKATKSNQQDDFLRIKDLIGLSITKWYWFVFTLVVALGIATYYILKVVPVYQRSASLLIKDDKKNDNTITTNSNPFINMGIFSNNTNVYNEIYSIKSPALMLEVVKRLHLDINYYSEGLWHKNVLYGNVLPITVRFEGLADNASCSFKVSFDKQGFVVMNDFTYCGQNLNGLPSLKTQFEKKVQTPVGNLIVSRSAYFCEGSVGEIEVVRSNIYSTIGFCLDKLSVGLADEETTIINLIYADESTQRAEDVLNTLISVYNENWVNDKNQIAVSTSEFINDRLSVIERELGNVDTDISSYKSEQQVPDLVAAADLALRESSMAHVNTTSLYNQVYMAKYIRSNLQNTATNKLLPANSGIDNPQLSVQIEDYNNKLLQRNSLVANSSEENPLVKDYDAILMSMRQNIVSSIDNQIASLNEQVRGQQSISGRAATQMSLNPKQAKYLLSVERQQKVKEALYMFLLQKREENELSQAFTSYNTRLVMPPSGANFPISPHPRKIYLIALVLGLMLPIVLLLIQENMNTKVRGRKDIEALTVPFVGEVPLSGCSKIKWYIKMLKSLMKKRSESEEYKIVVREGSRNIINEAFRVIRTNIEFMLAQKGQKVVMISSMNPSSGKTFIAANLGTSFAIKDQKVVVVDLDMRRSSLSHYIKNPDVGISSYFVGKIDDWHSIIFPVEGYENLHLIPVGKIPPNPAELLYSKNMQLLIDGLKEEFDVVILDCPPVEIVADTSIIAKYTDMTLFVIRADFLERDMLPVVENYYNEKKFNDMIILLNGTSLYHGRNGYLYGYGYAYADKD